MGFGGIPIKSIKCPTSVRRDERVIFFNNDDASTFFRLF